MGKKSHAGKTETKNKKKASPSVFILWKENSTHNLSRDMM
jgi:hypothetical protein